MKKVLFGFLAGTAALAMAETFQDFNNNLYAEYNYTSPNQGAGGGSFNNFGLGGTLQTAHGVWLNADVVAGSMIYNNTGSQVNQQTIGDYNLGLKAGYAFQFFNNDSNGFQVIPYLALASGNYTGGDSSTTFYTYGLGVKPEYRLFNSLKVSLDMSLNGSQKGASAYTSSGQNFGYAINPEIQYDINKTVMLAAGYAYNNSFNSQGSSFGDSGNSTITFKVGYLF